MAQFKSDLSQKYFSVTERVSGKAIRPSLLKLIQRDYPLFSSESFLSIDELNDYREKYIANYLTGQIGELTELEEKVLSSLTNKTTLADKMDEEDVVRTMGQRLADAVASFGGSWKFIISFSIFIVLWISINAFWLLNKGFDPYPFILLNLILSCLAAFQAPIIMMSQNRQEEKDRERGKKDYMINLKSELEIRTLHEKLDHLILHQEQELLEIQKVQIEMMNDIMKEVENKRS